MLLLLHLTSFEKNGLLSHHFRHFLKSEGFASCNRLVHLEVESGAALVRHVRVVALLGACGAERLRGGVCESDPAVGLGLGHQVVLLVFCSTKHVF